MNTEDKELLRMIFKILSSGDKVTLKDAIARTSQLYNTWPGGGQREDATPDHVRNVFNRHVKSLSINDNPHGD